jgi:hypothetical protein
MQEYIRVSAGFLVDRYEFAGGRKASDKELKSRERQVKNGDAIVVDEFSTMDKKKIHRK